MQNSFKITGTQINYYFVCKRELWLFSHQIQCEQESDVVLQGKLLHENSYKREHKEIQFGPVKIDWIDFDNKVVHEVKKSDKAEEAHIWQLKYYIWYLKQMGVGEFTGEINYPKLKHKEIIFLSENDENEIKSILNGIANVLALGNPPSVKTNAKICKSCSYYELCFI